MKDKCTSLNKILKKYGMLSKAYAKMKKASAGLIRTAPHQRRLLKARVYSPPLCIEETADIKLARKSRGKLFSTPEELIEDLHSYATDGQRIPQSRKPHPRKESSKARHAKASRI